MSATGLIGLIARRFSSGGNGELASESLRCGLEKKPTQKKLGEKRYCMLRFAMRISRYPISRDIFAVRVAAAPAHGVVKCCCVPGLAPVQLRVRAAPPDHITSQTRPRPWPPHPSPLTCSPGIRKIMMTIPCGLRLPQTQNLIEHEVV